MSNLKPRKLEAQRGRGASGFVIVIIFKVNKVYLCQENRVLFLREPFQSVGKEGFLRTNMSNSCWYLQSGWSESVCNLCARKIRNLGALFEVIRNAIGISSLLFPKLRQSSLSTCPSSCWKFHQATVHVETESVLEVSEIWSHWRAVFL